MSRSWSSSWCARARGARWNSAAANCWSREKAVCASHSERPASACSALQEAHNQAEAVRAHAEAHAAIRHSPVITPGGARLSTSGPRVVAATSSSRNFSGALGSVPEDGEIPSPAPGSKDIRRSQDIAVSAILDAARTASGQNLSAHLPPSPAAESPSGRGKSR